MVPFKYQSNFWKTLEISLINFETDLILTWSANCVLSTAADQTTKFATTDSKHFVPSVTLSTQYNVKPLQ